MHRHITLLELLVFLKRLSCTALNLHEVGSHLSEWSHRLVDARHQLRHDLGGDLCLLGFNNAVEVLLVVLEQQVNYLVISESLLIGPRDVAAEFLFKGKSEQQLQVLLGQLNLILDSLDAAEDKNLSEEDLNGGNHIGSSEFGSIQEVIDLLDQSLAELLTARYNSLAGIKHQLINPLIHFCRVLLAIVYCAQQDLEGDLELLACSISHDVQGAHKAEEAGGTTTSDLPMLLEQVKRQHSVYLLSSEALGESSSLTARQLGISETTMGVGVCLQIEDSLVLVGFT